MYPIPANAVVGSTDERRNAWNNLTETQQKAFSDQFDGIVKNAIANTKPDSSPVNISLSFVNGVGALIETSATANTKDSPEFGLDPEQLRPIDPCSSNCNPDPEPTPTPGPTVTPTPTPEPTPTPVPTPTPTPGGDLDQDGFPDSFENELANGFTPYYFVSAGEKAGTGFASFNNSLPQTVSQVFGATPPISNFRVTPLRHQTGRDGILYGLIQIDYLTLWNRDDGLVSGNLCVGNPFINPLELGSHPLDNERSAFLVAAPVLNGSYNFNPAAYKIYSVFTAAHENTFFDQSRFYNLMSPIGFNSHVVLGLSRSKHATYAFNPDYFPLFPAYIIVATYFTLYTLFITGQISELEYLIYSFLADQAFFACVIERFHDQGGAFANSKINVGELKVPLNNSIFIQDTGIRNKLNMRLW